MNSLIWGGGGTKEIVDRLHSRKAMARGRVREGDLAPPAQSVEAIVAWITNTELFAGGGGGGH